MATVTQAKARVAYTISGKSPEIRTAYESAGKTHKAGAFLYLSASQRLVPLGTGAVGQGDIVLGIAGQALKDGGNYTNSTTEVPFLVANHDTVWLANVASRFSAATATISAVHVGSVAGASCNGSRFYVSIRMVGATGSMVLVRGKFEDDAYGDTYGRVYFQFLKRAFYT